MGLAARCILASAAVWLCSPCLHAIPKLRVTNTVVGPISIATGQAGPQQEIEIYNAGDGNLNVQFLHTASWTQATTGARRACSQREGECIPVRISLNTQSLAAGSHSGSVRIIDPAAADAPQDILVLVNVGGGVPNRLDFFLPPDGGQNEALIHLNRCEGSPFGRVCMTTRTSTQSGGDWLSLALLGEGSFRFNVPYRVIAKHLPGMAEGTYQGTVIITDAQFAPDNKSVPVTLRVTSQPIATAGTTPLRLRVPQGTSRRSHGVAISNRGRGTLTVSNATGAADAGGTWLSAEQVAGTNAIAVNADPAGLNLGPYTGTVTVNSNAVNSPLTIPVVLEIVPQGPPTIQFAGVANNANFIADEHLARGVIAAAFGEQLLLTDPASASSLPLPTRLGDVQVFLNDQPVPIYFASNGQVNFQVPFEAQLGDGLMRIDRGGQRGNNVSVRILPSLPRLLRFFNGPYGIVVNQDGSFPVPASLGIPNSRPARAGETLVIYALGLGQTSPPVVSGASSPADPLARVPSPGGPRVFFGALALPSGVPAEPSYVGLTPGFVGLYQINVTVPPGVTPGDVPTRLQLDTVSSDFVLISVE